MTTETITEQVLEERSKDVTVCDECGVVETQDQEFYQFAINPTVECTGKISDLEWLFQQQAETSRIEEDEVEYTFHSAGTTRTETRPTTQQTYLVDATVAAWTARDFMRDYSFFEADASGDLCPDCAYVWDVDGEPNNMNIRTSSPKSSATDEDDLPPVWKRMAASFTHFEVVCLSLSIAFAVWSILLTQPFTTVAWVASVMMILLAFASTMDLLD